MISIRSLNKYFNKNKQNEIHVINDVSLELPESGIVALFGKSGCGKTTLLNTIGGLDTAENGSVLIDGRNIKSNTDFIRNHYIGYVFQNYNLNKQISVFDNVADALRLCGMTDKAEIEKRVLAALKNVGMDKYKARTPDTLSGGQMQRVAIARAIVKNPKIILADEPTGNLDDANTVLIMDLLKKISETHLVLLVTHEANLVDYYCDRVIELSDGRIISERENEAANGFVAKSKNDIYLGELEKTAAETNGVSVEYYGNAPKSPVRLRVINHGGKIYLSVDGENVQILDRSSEIKLREGVYSETERAEEKMASIDMSALPPFEGSRFGRLFGFLDSFKSGYRASFKRNKKSTKALRLCMLLFSVVLVFMSASLGTAFKSINDVKEQYNQNMFYVYTPQKNGDALSSLLNGAVGQHGIDALQVSTGIPLGNGSFSVSPGKFESFTSQSASFTAYASCLDYKYMAKSPTVLAGTAEEPTDDSVIITDTLADRLIDAATVGYISSYGDLIGLYASFNSNQVFAGNLRIAGIVHSEESCVYRSSLLSAKTVLYKTGLNSLAINEDANITLNNGETVLIQRTAADVLPKKGETIKINGKSFTVKDVIAKPKDYNEYLASLGSPLAQDGSILSLYDYSRQKVLSLNPEIIEGTEEFNAKLEEYISEHYLDYYNEKYKYFDSYITLVHTVELDIYPYLYLEKGFSKVKYYYICNYLAEYDDARNLYFIESYKKANGVYPDYSTLISSEEKISSDYDTLLSDVQSLESQYSNEFYNGVTYYGNRYLLTKSDYIALADTVGETHESLSTSNSFGVYDSEDELGFYLDQSSLRYTAIHSTNVRETEEFLKNATAGMSTPVEYVKVLYTPDVIFDDLMSDFRSTVVIKLTVLVVFLAVMSLCMYFIMRSSLMSRIKEVGIYRAIGVSKRNLIFRFLIEAFALTTLTVFIGYLISSAMLFALSASISLLETLLYYPVWLALSLLAVLYAVCLACGIIPIAGLLRKTPSEILSKYDI